MKDFKNLKIIKYKYPFSVERLGEILWDKMTLEESKWAIQLTLEGISDTGGDDKSSWDTIVVDKKMTDKIEKILEKYEISYVSEDATTNLIENINYFTPTFLNKLNEYLLKSLTVDGVLDDIIDKGVDNLSVFEKYFLDNDIESKK